jgi:hypothetical protein
MNEIRERGELEESKRGTKEKQGKETRMKTTRTTIDEEEAADPEAVAAGGGGGGRRKRI